MSLVSKPIKTGVFPAVAPSLRTEAPSRTLPRLAAHEPRVVLRLPDCSPSVLQVSEPLARGLADPASSLRSLTTSSAASVRSMATLKQLLSKPKTLLACVVGVSALLAVVILVSRSGQHATTPAHDEPTGGTVHGEVSPPIPRTSGPTISTGERRRSLPAASHSHDVHSSGHDARSAASAPVANEGASLAPETSSGPRGVLPIRTSLVPPAPESPHTAQGPWAKLKQPNLGQQTITR